MFYAAYKGFIIGVMISALMGPVGVLCIQRTIYRGRWHGFFSGVGASFSDFLYAIISCTSIDLVGDFIEKNRTWLQFLGSILLIIFGGYTFFKKISKDLNFKKIEKRYMKSYSYSKNTLTVFLLAVSNPFIIFLYISLFDKFGLFSVRNDKICGLSFIFIGNLLWWFVITYLVSKFRKAFDIRKLYIMNKIIGIIAIFLAFWKLFICLI